MRAALLSLLAAVAGATAALVSSVAAHGMAGPAWAHTNGTQPSSGGTEGNVSFGTATAMPAQQRLYVAASGTGAPDAVYVTFGGGTGGFSPDVAACYLTAAPQGGGLDCKWDMHAGELSEGRCQGCATWYNGQLVLAGGHNNSGAYSGTVDVFQVLPGTQGLNRTTTMMLPVGRELLGCATLGDKSFFAGGKQPHSLPGQKGETDRVDIYDHTTGTWSLQHLSVARKKVEAVSVGREVLFAGGELASSGARTAAAGSGGGEGSPLDYSSSVDIYDIDTAQWRTANLSVARQYFALVSVNGLMIAAGGFANDAADAEATRALHPGMVPPRGPYAGHRCDTVDIYNATSKQWNSAYKLSVPRSNLMGAVVADRYALFAGGTTETIGRSDVVDVFDTFTGEWSSATLGVGRTSLAAAGTGTTAFFGGLSYDVFTLM